MIAFLNLSLGSLVFGPSQHVLRARLPISDFLSWSIPFELKRGHPECPESDIELDEEFEIGDESFYVCLRFSDYCLHSIALRNAGAEYRHGLFFYREGEKKCEPAHKKWIARYTSGQTEWPWGSIHSYYDELYWGVAIFIDYHMKEKKTL